MKWFKGRSRDRQRDKQPAPLIEELEPRVLLSADAAGFVASDFDTFQQPPTELLLDENLEPAPADNVVQEEAQRLELVFVDANTPDADTLVQSLLDDADDNRRIEVLTLDAHRDGIWQITRALEEHRATHASTRRASRCSRTSFSPGRMPSPTTPTS